MQNHRSMKALKLLLDQKDFVLVSNDERVGIKKYIEISATTLVGKL
jgi:hypothetical protein